MEYLALAAEGLTMPEPRIPHPNPFAAAAEDLVIDTLSRRLKKLEASVANELGIPMVPERSEARKATVAP